MIAAIILAAGESRRMGRPKALVSYRGLTFIEHLLQATQHPRIGERRVVLGAHADEIRAQFPAGRFSVVVNDEWEKGPLSSIQAALRTLPPSGIDGIMICPVDHPLVSEKLVAALIDAFDSTGRGIVVPKFQSRRGHPVLFRSTLVPELMSAPLDVGARAVVRAHRGEIVEVPTEEEAVVLNLNDPAALARLGE
jgi:CTP:molybdopterin cytidylyltransferase MocA